jgi:hypothetical protein
MQNMDFGLIYYTMPSSSLSYRPLYKNYFCKSHLPSNWCIYRNPVYCLSLDASYLVSLSWQAPLPAEGGAAVTGTQVVCGLQLKMLQDAAQLLILFSQV